MAGRHFFVKPCKKGGWVDIMSHKRISVLLVVYWWWQHIPCSQLQLLRRFKKMCSHISWHLGKKGCVDRQNVSKLLEYNSTRFADIPTIQIISMSPAQHAVMPCSFTHTVVKIWVLTDHDVCDETAAAEQWKERSGLPYRCTWECACCLNLCESQCFVHLSDVFFIFRGDFHYCVNFW